MREKVTDSWPWNEPAKKSHTTWPWANAAQIRGFRDAAFAVMAGKGLWPPFRLVGATAEMVRDGLGGVADFYVDPLDPGEVAGASSFNKHSTR